MAPPNKLPSGTWTIGVTGATGDFGRMILEQLLDQFNWPPNQLVAICRDSNRELAMKWKARGLLVREADFDDDMSPAVKAAHPNRMRLVDAYSGVDRLMIISVSSFSNWYHLHANAINAAVDAGVQHIVYTSTPTLSTKNPPLTPLPPEDPQVEQLLRNCGRNYTILGNNVWYDDIIDNIYRQFIQQGTIYTLDPESSAAHISKRDCAFAAATVLTRPNEQSRKYEISGPELITRTRIAELCTKYHLGPKPVAVKLVDEDTLREEVGKMTRDSNYREAIIAFDKAYRDGNFARVDFGFYEITGTQPESFDEYMKRRSQQKAVRASSSGENAANSGTQSSMSTLQAPHRRASVTSGDSLAL